ncbi:MAG TPA: hypothetical protein VHC01_14205 [Gaiellaceae bacterium]|nr:hypothetical protein [Gaiellaceae bacterium]
MAARSPAKRQIELLGAAHALTDLDEFRQARRGCCARRCRATPTDTTDPRYVPPKK